MLIADTIRQLVLEPSAQGPGFGNTLNTVVIYRPRSISDNLTWCMCTCPICRYVRCVNSCIGEQDESAFDISQLKKPVQETRLRAPAVEKVMPPPIPSADRPRTWGKIVSTFMLWSLTSSKTLGTIRSAWATAQKWSNVSFSGLKT